MANYTKIFHLGQLPHFPYTFPFHFADDGGGMALLPSRKKHIGKAVLKPLVGLITVRAKKQSRIIALKMGALAYRIKASSRKINVLAGLKAIANKGLYRTLRSMIGLIVSVSRKAAKHQTLSALLGWKPNVTKIFQTQRIKVLTLAVGLQAAASRKVKYISVFTAKAGLLAIKIRLFGRKFSALAGLKAVRQRALSKNIKPAIGFIVTRYKRLSHAITVSLGIYILEKRLLVAKRKMVSNVGWKTSTKKVFGMPFVSKLGLLSKRYKFASMSFIVSIGLLNTVTAKSRQLIQGLTSAIFTGVQNTIKFISRNVF
jgi:hypothetical protein